ncbi:MAG: DUF3372 domain-containing protein, partial [Caldilineaceae bacterium]|nr:DUF3372 domain-containing protein [Caldilineaceae bacterium]
KSSPLFRLQTADDVMQRLAFHNTGPNQIPGVIVMSLSDMVEPDLDADREFIVVVFNANDAAQNISVNATAGMALGLHPLQTGLAASFDAAIGTFTVPARTTAVFVDGTAAANVVRNPSFEAGKERWHFYTNASGNFQITDAASVGDHAALVRVNAVGSNVQLYQYDLVLEPNTRYSLRFDAKSNNGRDMQVVIHKHGVPYTYYGAWMTADLTADYQSYHWEFTTANFTETVNDGRIRFWFAPYARAGDEYMIDNVVLTEQTNMASPTTTVGASSVSVRVVAVDDADLLVGGAVDESAEALSPAALQLFMPFVTK